MPGRSTRSRASLGTAGDSESKTDHTQTTINKQSNHAGRKRNISSANVKHELDTDKENIKSSAKRQKKEKPKPDFEEAARVAKKIQTDPDASDLSPSKAKTSKTYNLTPGASPYPSYNRPTPEECHNVNKILTATHGRKTAPKAIPAPNLQSSGCGEVPSVLDALVRTRLSANTNNANSSRAFRGLVERFGILKQGVGKGSVDWDAVRVAPNTDVYEAIKSGGLAAVKSRDIQKILQLVYEENQSDKSFKGEYLLSLDHLHGMKTEEAFDKLLTYPGVGPKTASCVLLFCMQRPSFAVDTHVFRLVSWLGWMPSPSAVRRMGKEAKAEGQKPPPPVSRNTTYAHLDVRIPDELKYSLHYLLIRHGKTCPYCSAKKDSKIREAWGDKKCPLASLKSGKNMDEVMEEADEMDIKSEDGEEEEMVKSEDEESDDADVKAEGEED
ncbi:MAG: hypothetical protein GOMPHAMPRED_007531 [Gomphillus americanus]|uniref:HhH-GPD domain-containing protein n=1 Tax=Gomphillus americanus TaxID=1940652 RepID=A0A8H3IBB2_9LECA|nr:MAG: hypothetical protein GOMPHAMPRED_007531 [Gomphillus americanus]